MSFDSEWSQLKADATGQQSAHTRLNRLAAAGGGGEELIAASLRHRDGSAVSVSGISKIVK
ncbi:hypothetical protein ACFV2X_46735 [Streptomyces sp. NPDC059679]|uniref:hypothetical protein n=1 Tax=Streptomyces sp. NPDC059679 TaxID=3346903 RepID=UPI00369652DD